MKQYKFKEVYDKRWSASRNTGDSDILAIDRPRNQVQFFYREYNRFISSMLTKHLGDTTGKRLLEVGCGRATSSIYQAITLGMNITVTDYSEAALEVARDNLGKYDVEATTLAADLYALPFENAHFDAVISLGVMEHIENPVSAYAEMYRVLKNDGLMISMNVPERPDNIQRIATPVNRFLSSVEALVTSKESKPWLDKASQSKTADVYRSVETGEAFADHAERAGFQEPDVYEVNPFPTFSPVPGWLDGFVTTVFRLILKLRDGVTPFMAAKENSRAHFIVAQKRAS